LSKKPDDPTGRVVIDDRGRAVWKTSLDTAQLKALAQPLSLEGEEPAAGAEPGEKRRTLDDMRKLSEEIKASKVWYRGPKPRGPSST